MSKVIRIDNDVFKALQIASVKFSMQLSTPNNVLRRVLDIDTQGALNLYCTDAKSVNTLIEDDQLKAPRMSAAKLSFRHSETLKVRAAYVNRRGTQYAYPRRFPVVLFDRWGYVRCSSDRSLKALIKKYGSLGKRGLFMYFRPSISIIPDYHKCKHDHAELV